MSQERAIWNDGQGLATPDLQRPANDAGAADDRVYEVLVTPGAVQKKILPLSEESATVNPRLLAIPSAVGLTPAGVNGAIRLMPCALVAGSAASTQQISLEATLYAPLDTAAIGSNSSGSTRYDLVYATINRAVTTTGTRKIKSATDGTLSSQTVNLADNAATTLSVNAGFLTGGTPPTQAQINAALPADTAPSSSTFGSFNFPIAYVSVFNGYASGAVIGSNPTFSALTQCWPGGAIAQNRVRGARPMSIYYGAAAEKVSSVLSNNVALAERWSGNGNQFFSHFKILSTTGATINAGVVLDNSIDWRNRIVYGFWAFLTSAVSMPLEGSAATGNITPSTATGTNPQPVLDSHVLPISWTGPGINAPAFSLQYSNSGSPVTISLGVTTAGVLMAARSTGAPANVGGDVIVLVLYASDQLLLNG